MHKMKQYIFLFLCFGIYSGITAQPLPDSIRTLYTAAKNDSERGRLLTRYFDLITNDDSILQKLSALKGYFKTVNDPSAEDYVQLSFCRV